MSLPTAMTRVAAALSEVLSLARTLPPALRVRQVNGRVPVDHLLV